MFQTIPGAYLVCENHTTRATFFPHCGHAQQTFLDYYGMGKLCYLCLHVATLWTFVSEPSKFYELDTTSNRKEQSQDASHPQ